MDAGKFPPTLPLPLSGFAQNYQAERLEENRTLLYYILGMNHQETGAKPGNEDVLVNDQSKIGVQIHNCCARKLPAPLNELGSVTFHLQPGFKNNKCHSSYTNEM